MGFYLTPGRTASSGGWAFDDVDWYVFGSPFGPGSFFGAFQAFSPAPGTDSVAYIVTTPSAFGGPGTYCYRTTDNGHTWVLAGIILPGVNATDPQVVARNATDLFFLYGDRFLPEAGIYRSVDSGGTWTRIVTFPPTSGKKRSVGYMAVATSNIFWAELLQSGSAAGSVEALQVYRANLDGSGVALLGTWPFGPRGESGIYRYPATVRMVTLSDDAALVCSKDGDYGHGTSFVPYPTTLVPTTALLPIGDPQMVTPQDFPAGCELAIYWHYDSATWAGGPSFTPLISFAVSYQNDDLSWSTPASFGAGFAVTTGNTRITTALSVPCGPRLMQCYASSDRAVTLQGVEITEAYSRGLLLEAASGGLVDRRPAGLRRPWDVLRLSGTRWVVAGGATDATDVSVFRTDNAGSSWSGTSTIPSADGFILRGTNGMPQLAITTPGSTTDVAMLGNASATIQQQIWLSEDATDSWTLELNQAEFENASGWVVLLPGGIYGTTAAPVLTATPGLLATIVG